MKKVSDFTGDTVSHLADTIRAFPVFLDGKEEVIMIEIEVAIQLMLGFCTLIVLILTLHEKKGRETCIFQPVPLK